MADKLSLGEPAEQTDWRALVEQGLKGAKWERLIGRTADGVDIQPVYREADFATGADPSGFPGAAPFVRGGAGGPWLIRQTYAHPDPQAANQDILEDLKGGVSAIELVIDPSGAQGVAICDASDLDLALADIILEAAPVALDAGPHGLYAAKLLEAKLKGVAPAGLAFNIDPLGALMRGGAMGAGDVAEAAAFAARTRQSLPAATALRADARAVHEAGGTEAQEIAVALAAGIHYLRALSEAGLSADEACASLLFTLSVGPDVLVEAAKLRALRLCWARVAEASGAAPAARAARIHAVTSRRMMTRYDSWTNILRVTTAAFGAAIGGAQAITTLPVTDALGAPTPFARRVARNTQHVLLEESRLAHVADPAGGAWFAEKLTRDLAEKAWAQMQSLEAQGGLLAALQSGALQSLIATAREARQKAFASRRETVTGVTDFPLLDGKGPDVQTISYHPSKKAPAASNDVKAAALAPIRWAAPFENLRDRTENLTPRPAVFFATLGALTEFGPRAQFSRNLLGVGGVAARGEEHAYKTRDDMVYAFRESGLKAAILCGTDAAYAEEAENAAQRLKAAGCAWLIYAGKPADEAALRAAGVDQFIFAGQDALAALQTLHKALGLDK